MRGALATMNAAALVTEQALLQHILRVDDASDVERFLRDRQWIDPASRVTGVARAGEGYMNLVLRVTLEGGDRPSVILKQARPWVEKFPDIAAPVERAEIETAFYRLAGADAVLARRLPQLLAADPQQHVALYTDLGAVRDFTNRYAGATLDGDDARTLLDWLGGLHRLPVDPGEQPELANRAMRALNRVHIFDLPLSREGPDAEAFCHGLGRMAATLRSDAALRRRMQTLAGEYERDGTHLLHGDFYPGSWLSTDAGPVVIDPEFGHFGTAEFDLGVFIAHLYFTGSDPALAECYPEPPGFDHRLARAFAGAELIRRLIGVAQLPLAADLARRERWLEIGQALVRS